MAVNWVEKVGEAMKLGFSKVCVIDRASYGCLGASDATHIATLWEFATTDPDGNEVKETINENQELLEWGQKEGKPKKTFSFFGKRLNILQRLEDGKALVCLKGKDVIVAYQFKAAWFVAYAEIAGAAATADAAAGAPKASFGSAPAAFSKIMKEIWEEIAEDEE